MSAVLAQQHEATEFTFPEGREAGASGEALTRATRDFGCSTGVGRNIDKALQ